MSRHKNTAKVQIEEDEIETGSEESEDDDSLEEIIEEEEEEEEEEKPKKKVVRKRRPRKQTAKSTANAILNGNLGLGIVPSGQINSPNPFMPQIIQQSNAMTHDQYHQIAEGVVQVFENTLMTAMSYNYALNSATLVHAYRALKLMNVLQFPAALEAANMAATHDITWVNFRDSILQANRIIGIRV